MPSKSCACIISLLLHRLTRNQPRRPRHMSLVELLALTPPFPRRGNPGPTPRPAKAPPPPTPVPPPPAPPAQPARLSPRRFPPAGSPGAAGPAITALVGLSRIGL